MNVVRIPAYLDRRFRRALLEASKVGGPEAQDQIRSALANGPSRGGIAETLRYFGKTDARFLAHTAHIIDGIEVTVPGFKQWLEATGFGNDKTMIRGFLAWADYVNAEGSVIPDAKRAFLHS